MFGTTSTNNKIGARYKFRNIVVPRVRIEKFFTGADEFDSKMPLQNQPVILIEGPETAPITVGMVSAIKRHQHHGLRFYYLDMLGWSRPYENYIQLNDVRNCAYIGMRKTKECCDFVNSLTCSTQEDRNAVIFVVVAVACTVSNDRNEYAAMRDAVIAKREIFPNLCLVLATDAMTNRPGARMYSDLVYKTVGPVPTMWLALVKSRVSDTHLANIKQPFKLESP